MTGLDMTRPGIQICVDTKIQLLKRNDYDWCYSYVWHLQGVYRLAEQTKGGAAATVTSNGLVRLRTQTQRIKFSVFIHSEATTECDKRRISN